MAAANWYSARLVVIDGTALEPDDKNPYVAVDGVAVRVNKNWLSIEHEDAHTHRRFTFPVVAQVWSGCVLYGPMRICAFRGPQEGVYALVEWAATARYSTSRPISGRTLLVGVYAYEMGERVELTLKALQFAKDILDRPEEDFPDVAFAR